MLEPIHGILGAAVMEDMMRTVDSLYEDHRRLRTLLDQLEEALAGGPELRSSVRAVCVDFLRVLRAHIHREGRLAVLCSQRLGTWNADALARFAVEHHADQQYLQVIFRCASRPSSFSVEGLGPALQGFRRGLRVHMDEQERDLLPFLNGVLRTRVLAQPGGRDWLPLDGGSWQDPQAVLSVA